MPTLTASPMLTPDDLAAELGVSLMTLRRWRRDVDRWLDSRTAA